MIDFTNAVEKMNFYRGSEKKKTLLYNNKRYLVKFPDPIRQKNKNISYINNSFSEYIGSNIFRLCGFDVQDTILGKYIYNNNEKIVCACLDFTDDNNMLNEFESIALSTNPEEKIDTEIRSIIKVIEENKNIINKNDVIDKFFDMFIIDSLIGNTDRHNGNWGFILNKKTEEIKFSKIYDCGSCLNPMLEDKEIEKLDKKEIKNLAINCYSCLKENGKKINYMSYIKSKKNRCVNDALKRVFNNIKIDEINKFIDDIECISTTRKNFYKEIINERYEILKETYKNIG